MKESAQAEFSPSLLIFLFLSSPRLNFFPFFSFLPTGRYQNMDRMWRKSMEGAQRTPEVIKFCSNITLLETFKECNKLLDQVGGNEWEKKSRALLEMKIKKIAIIHPPLN